MPSQSDFANLDQLRLSLHGDAIERFYWPIVSQELSEYEVFWKKFVVLLTNRVVPRAGSDWIMLRKDVSKEYESLTMSNYTTFYHCAVAREQIEIGRKAKNDHGFNHPELFFFSAKACLDSLKALQAQSGVLVRRVGSTDAVIRPTFPKSPDDMIHAITSYRDVFTHRAHLGRGSQHRRDLIPKLEHLPKSKRDSDLLWSYTMSLDEQEMTDALDYQLKLWTALAQYLQGTWRGLAHTFEELPVDPAFIRELGLVPFLPIYPGIASPVQPSLANPQAASGTVIYGEMQTHKG